MAKQRKLNKNLIATLTFSSMLVVLAVAFLVVINAAQRSPEVVAEKAKLAEKNGDLPRAFALYYKAFNSRKEAKYLLDQSRVAMAMGEIGMGLGKLDQADKQSPDDVTVLSTILEKAWELRGIGWPQAEELFRYSESLLKLQPDSALALVSLFDAADTLKEKDPPKAKIADEAMEKLIKLAPNDAKLAMVRSTRELRDAMSKYRGRPLDAAEMAVATREIEAATDRADAIMRAAIKENPKVERLYTGLATMLRQSRRFDAAKAVMSEGAAALPDDADVRYKQAEVISDDILRINDPSGPPGDPALVAEGLEAAKKAVELEPTSYGAYRMRALLTERSAKLDGRWEKDEAGVRKEILDGLSKALFDTSGLKSLKAVLRREEREKMFAEAFDVAMRYYEEAKSDDDKKAMYQYVKRTLEDTRTQFRESIYVPLMEGRLALAENDKKVAIRRFEEADKLAGTGRPLLSRMAKENLTRLHADEQRYKPALDYAAASIAIYEQLGLVVPHWLKLQRAAMLIALAKPQEALDALDSMLAENANDPDVPALRARVLAMLNRNDEAMRELEKVQDRPALQLERARVVAHAGDLGQAEQIVNGVLDKKPDNMDAVKLYAQIMMRAEKTDVAAARLREVAGRVTDEDAKRAIETYVILVTTKDPAERDRRILELIQSVPDACARSGELFNFYLLKRDYETAAKHLDDVEGCKKDDMDVARMQFFVRVQLKQFDKAEAYATKLTKANADRVLGATFRGQLKTARGDYDGALVEYRAAERELPSDVEIKTRIAEALLRSQPPKLDEAITSLKGAIDFDPRNFALNRLLYVALEQAGRRDEGIPYLEAAATISPGDPFVKERLALIEEARDPTKGVARREAALDKNPGNVEDLLALVELHEKSKDLDKATARMKEAERIAPTNPAVARMAARYYTARGMQKDGETALRNFVTQSTGPVKLDGMLLLARFYEAFNDRATAQSVYMDASRAVDEIAGSDTELRDRSRTAINLGLADFYGRGGDAASQIDALRTALKILKPGEKDDAALRDTRLRLVSVLVLTGDLTGADKEVQQYRKDYPNDVRGMIAEADLITRRATSPEALEQAKVLITKVIEQKPEHVYSLLMRGRIYMAQGKYSDAKDDFLRCKKSDPKAQAYEPRMELIRVYEATNQAEPAESEARELLNELTASKEPNPQGIQRVGMTLLGVLERSNKTPRAQELVNELIAKYPQDPFWRLQAARILAGRKEFSTAVDAAKAAVELSNGSDARYVSAWFDTLNQAGRSREVINALSAIKPEGLAANVRAAIVDAYVRSNDRTSAIAELDRGILQASNSNVEQLNFLVGMTEPLLGAEAVIERLRQALANPPTQLSDMQKIQYTLRLKSALGLSLVQTGEPTRREEGLKMIDDVLAGTERGSKLRGGALAIKGTALERLGKPQEAADVYTEILKTDPTNEHALNNLAYLLIDKLNQPALGLKYAEQANLFRPGDSNIIDTLGWAYFKNNNAARSEATLQEALRLNANNLQTLWHLAQVVRSVGRATDARKYLEKLRDAAKEANNAEFLKNAEDSLADKWPQ